MEPVTRANGTTGAGSGSRKRRAPGVGAGGHNAGAGAGAGSGGAGARSTADGAGSGRAAVLERGSHPYGVQPLGNLWYAMTERGDGAGPRAGAPGATPKAARVVRTRDAGLGRLARLPDSVVQRVLECLDERALCRACCVSRSLYVFVHSGADLWKNLTLLAGLGDDFLFRASWKDTFAGAWVAARARCSECSTSRTEGCEACARQRKHVEATALPAPHRPIKVPGFYSDFLYEPWACASMDINPAWLATDNVARVHAPTVDEFVERFEKPNKPVVITGVVDKWPAVTKWTPEYLTDRFGDRLFTCGSVQMSMARYYRYATGTTEERPLYMFDKFFADTAPELADDYAVPRYFADDLFDLLIPKHGSSDDRTTGEAGAVESRHRDAKTSGSPRPANRWLIIGPKRSGSTFHIDPNGTSAWNALVRGGKKWVMYPPGTTPPGVHASADMSEVATTVSVMEWFRQFYAHRTKGGTCTPVEFESRPGDLVFVPRGWWHIALNTSDEVTVAITQNLCSPCALHHVLDFLRTKPGQVSGLPHKWRPGMYERFLAALEAERPALVAPYTAMLAKRAREAAARHRAWGHVHGGGDGGSGGAKSGVAFSMFGDADADGEGDGDGDGGGDASGAGGFVFNFG